MIHSNNESRITERLYDLILKNEVPFIASINGEWGTGKTYFWNNFSTQYLKEMRIAYISLFGHDSIQSIQNKILLQIAPKNKKINWLKEKSKYLKSNLFKESDISLSIDGGLINVILGLLEAKDFKNVVICFDDLERLSDKLDIKDVMGLISDLKEQKKCKVIILTNLHELNKHDSLKKKNIKGKIKINGTEYEGDFDIGESKSSDTYEAFEEKLLDYKFHYKVDTVGNFKKIEKAIDIFDKDQVLKIFQEFNLINIRAMDRIIKFLNEFQLLKSIEIHPKVKNEILEKAIEIMYLHIFYQFTREDEFKQLSPLKSKNNKINNIKNVLKRKYFAFDEFALLIIQYLEYGYLDTEYFIFHIDEKTKSVNNSSVRDELFELLDQYRFDFHVNQIEFENKIKNVIENNIQTIVKHFGVDNFIYYISLFEDQNKYEHMAIKAFENYIDNLFENQNSLNIFDRGNLTKILDYNPKLNDYYEIKRADRLKKSIVDYKQIMDVMETIIHKGAWSEKAVEILEAVENESYKNFILKHKDFSLTVYEFMKFVKHNGYFKDVAEKIKQSYKLISNESVEYEKKIKEIYRLLQIEEK